jgi:hypothetical protein
MTHSPLLPNYRKFTANTAVFAVWLGWFAVSAQSVPVLRQGNLELTAIGGFNGGGSLSSVATTAVNTGATPLQVVTPSSNGSIGLRFSGSLTRRLLATVEWTYIAGGRIEFNQDYYFAQAAPTTLRTTVDAHASTMEFNGGLEYLFPITRAKRLIPFASVGGSAFRSAGDLTFAAIGGPPGNQFSGRFRTYHPAIGEGGGLRYYFGERVGFRVEGRLYQARNLGVFGRLGFGIFYRFR